MTPSRKRKMLVATARPRQRKRQKLLTTIPTHSSAETERSKPDHHNSTLTELLPPNHHIHPPPMHGIGIPGNLSSAANSVIATKYSTASAPSPVYDLPVPMALPEISKCCSQSQQSQDEHFPEPPVSNSANEQCNECIHYQQGDGGMDGMDGNHGMHSMDNTDSMDVPLPILNEQYTSSPSSESRLSPSSEFQKCHVCGYSSSLNVDSNSSSTLDCNTLNTSTSNAATGDTDNCTSSATVTHFECIECHRPRTECNECFKECSYCYDRDIAKVCWDCQRGYVVLECLSCDKVIEFQHASCIGIDWQSLFERCNFQPFCDVMICVDCHVQITGAHKGDTGTFRNCGFCDGGNEYLCNAHCHQHVYQ